MAEVYKVEIFKYKESAGPHDSWSNTYALAYNDAATPIDSPMLDSDVQNIVNAEKNLHTDDVMIDRAVISTYGEDIATEDEVVKVKDVGQRGLAVAVAGTDMQPLDVVLAVAFSAGSGRSGVKNYRGCLNASMVNVSDGNYVFTGNQRQIISDTFLGGFGNTQTLSRLCIASKFGDSIKARMVTQIVIKGIRRRQRFQQKRAKLSQEEGAIVNRIKAASKELIQIIASMAAFDKSKDYKRPLVAQEALAGLQESAQGVLDTNITIAAGP